VFFLASRAYRIGFPAALVILALATSASAANLFVRQGATGSGNGSDWSNAFPQIPAALVRGNTYYVADGAYPSYEFDDPESGTTLIIIKKAIESDHGTDVGWDPSFGDGQAVFTGCFHVRRGYFTLDGNSPIGSYGFKLLGCSSRYMVWVGVNVASKLPRITIKGLEIDCNRTLNARGMNVNGVLDSLFANIDIYHCDNDHITFGGANQDTVWEYLNLHDHTPVMGSPAHPDAFELCCGPQDNITIRYSRISHPGQQIWFNGQPPTQYGTFYIYGNTFDCAGRVSRVSCKGVVNDDRIKIPLGPMYIYNNSFVNMYRALNLYAGVTGEVRNNIFHNSKHPPLFGAATHTYNYYSGGTLKGGEAHAQSGRDPFVNSAHGDYRLASGTAAGVNLPAPFDKDPLNSVRGSDGIWDRGAFEFDKPHPVREQNTLRGSSKLWGMAKRFPAAGQASDIHQ